MEIYGEVPPNFDNWLRSQCEELDLLRCTIGQRHIEPFVQLPID